MYLKFCKWNIVCRVGNSLMNTECNCFLREVNRVLREIRWWLNKDLWTPWWNFLGPRLLLLLVLMCVCVCLFVFCCCCFLFFYCFFFVYLYFAFLFFAFSLCCCLFVFVYVVIVVTVAVFYLSNIQSLCYVHLKMATFLHRSMIESIFNVITTLNNHHLAFWWDRTSEYPFEALLVLS